MTGLPNDINDQLANLKELLTKNRGSKEECEQALEQREAEKEKRQAAKDEAHNAFVGDLEELMRRQDELREVQRTRKGEGEQQTDFMLDIIKENHERQRSEFVSAMHSLTKEREAAHVKLLNEIPQTKQSSGTGRRS